MFSSASFAILFFPFNDFSCVLKLKGYNMAQRTFALDPRDQEPVSHRTRTRYAAQPSAATASDTNTRLDMLTSIVDSLAQQQTLLTRMATAVASPASTVNTAAPSRTSSSPLVRAIELPKLGAPDSTDMAQFHDWEKRWNDYVTLTQADREFPSAASGQAFLRQALDRDWTVLWSSGRLGTEDSDSSIDVIHKLERYLRARCNPLIDRKRFHSRDQQAGESVDQYVSALSQIDAAYDFPMELTCDTCGQRCGHAAEFREMRLRDRLVCGLRCKEMQRRVCEEQFGGKLSLDRVLQLCAAFQSSRDTEQQLSGTSCHTLGLESSFDPSAAENSVEVAAVSKSTYKKQRFKGTSATSSSPKNPMAKRCPYCGENWHPRDVCKASGVKCQECGKVGHFAVVCRQRFSKGVSSLYLHLAEKSHGKFIKVDVSCADASTSSLFWLPDSGAEIDAIGVEDLDTIDRHLRLNLAPDYSKVYAANGTCLGSLGQLEACLTLNGRSCQTVLYVYRQLRSPLLSKTTCMKLGLLEDGWLHTRITHDVNRLSLPLPHASSSSIATNTQETSTETQSAPSSLSSASSQNIGPGTQEVSDARDSMIADFSKVFSEEPFRAMEGPPMHIDLVDGTVPCRDYPPTRTLSSLRLSLVLVLEARRVNQTLAKRSAGFFLVRL